MAKWVSADALRVQDLGLTNAVNQGIAGYRFGQEQKGIRDQEELGSMMAAIPEAEQTTQMVASEQSNMLADQTADFADEPVIANPHQVTAIPESEAAVQQMGKRKKTTTSKDWKSWEEGIRKKAGAMGPKALADANAHISTTKQGSLRENAATAMAAMRAGDLRTAKDALQEAYTSFPDGNRAEIEEVGGKLVANIYNEDTGQLVESKPIGPQDMADIVRISEDPVAYADAVRQAELDAVAVAEDRTRFDITEGRLSTQVSNDMTLGERRLKMQEGQAAIDAVRSGVQNEESRQKMAQIVSNMEELVKASKRADDMTEADINKAESSIEKTKADMEIDAAKLKLEQIAYIGDGASRNLKRQKIDAEIKELEAKAAYYAGGGTKAAGKTYFAKRNDLLQRMNTAAKSMEAADEAMASENKRAEFAKSKGKPYTINPTVEKAYQREQERYKLITDMWTSLEQQYEPKDGPEVVSPASAIPAPGTPAATPSTAGPAIGATATNPTTGEVVEWDGTNWIPM